MSTQHTPGPWHYDDGFAWVLGLDGGFIADVFDGTRGTATNHEIAIANARLISAAPELLAAAKRALTVLKAQGESVRASNVLGALDAAISKAIGEA